MLSSKCTTSLLRTDPTGSMWKWYSGPVILQAVPVPISKQSYFSKYRTNNGEIHRGIFACMWLLSAVIFILLRLKWVPTGNSCSLLAIPTFRSRTPSLASTGVFPKIPPSCSSPGSMSPWLPTFFSFVCSLPWGMLAKISAPAVRMVPIASD